MQCQLQDIEEREIQDDVISDESSAAESAEDLVMMEEQLENDACLVSEVEMDRQAWLRQLV